MFFRTSEINKILIIVSKLVGCFEVDMILEVILETSKEMGTGRWMKRIRERETERERGRENERERDRERKREREGERQRERVS